MDNNVEQDDGQKAGVNNQSSKKGFEQNQHAFQVCKKIVTCLEKCRICVLGTWMETHGVMEAKPRVLTK